MFIPFLSAAVSALGIAALQEPLAILFGFVKAALDQVGIATDVTGALLYATLAAVAGVIIVGVGGGLIKPMPARSEDALTEANSEKGKIKAEAKANSGSTSTPTSTPTSAVDAYPSDPTDRSGSTTASSTAVAAGGSDATAAYGTPRR